MVKTGTVEFKYKNSVIEFQANESQEITSFNLDTAQSDGQIWKSLGYFFKAFILYISERKGSLYNYRDALSALIPELKLRSSQYKQYEKEKEKTINLINCTVNFLADSLTENRFARIIIKGVKSNNAPWLNSLINKPSNNINTCGLFIIDKNRKNRVYEVLLGYLIENDSELLACFKNEYSSDLIIELLRYSGCNLSATDSALLIKIKKDQKLYLLLKNHINSTLGFNLWYYLLTRLSINKSKLPSKTDWLSDVSTSVRKSLTSLYGCKT